MYIGQVEAAAVPAPTPTTAAQIAAGIKDVAVSVLNFLTAKERADYAEALRAEGVDPSIITAAERESAQQRAVAAPGLLASPIVLVGAGVGIAAAVAYLLRR